MVAAVETEPVVVPVPPGTRGDTGEFHHNRRRALLIAAVPGVVVFIVVGVGLCRRRARPRRRGRSVSRRARAVVGAVAWRHPIPGARCWVPAPVATPSWPAAENLVDGLCATMGLESPDILVIDEWSRQALALGRQSGAAVLVVTSGLLESLDPVYLEGVLAHELVHVKRADIAPATMAAAMLLPVAPFFPVSGLVHALAGRGREFRTDRLAVAVTRFPPGLRDALVAHGRGPRTPGPVTARPTRGLTHHALAVDGGTARNHRTETSCVGTCRASSTRPLSGSPRWRSGEDEPASSRPVGARGPRE